jgi:hypothetical protein
MFRPLRTISIPFLFEFFLTSPFEGTASMSAETRPNMANRTCPEDSFIASAASTDDGSYRHRRLSLPDNTSTLVEGIFLPFSHRFVLEIPSGTGSILQSGPLSDYPSNSTVFENFATILPRASPSLHAAGFIIPYIYALILITTTKLPRWSYNVITNSEARKRQT